MGGDTLDRPEVPPLFCGVSVKIMGGEKEAAREARDQEWDARWDAGGWMVRRNGERVGPQMTSLSQAIAFPLGREAGRDRVLTSEGL